MTNLRVTGVRRPAAQARVGAGPVQQLADHAGTRSTDRRAPATDRCLDDDLHDDRRLRVPTPGNGPANARAHQRRRDQRASGRPTPASLPGADLVGHHPARRRPIVGVEPARPAACGSAGRSPPVGAGSPIERYVVTVGGRRAGSTVGAERRRVGTVYCAQRRRRRRSRTARSVVVLGERAQQRAQPPRDLEQRVGDRHARGPADLGRRAHGIRIASPTATTRDRRLGRGLRRQRRARSATTTSRCYTGVGARAAPSTGVEEGNPTRRRRRPGSAARRAARDDPATFDGLSAEPDLQHRRLRLQRPGLHGDRPRSRRRRARRPGTVTSIVATRRTGRTAAALGLPCSTADTIGSGDADSFVYRLQRRPDRGVRVRSDAARALPHRRHDPLRQRDLGAGQGVPPYPRPTLCSADWSRAVPARRRRAQLDARRPRAVETRRRGCRRRHGLLDLDSPPSGAVYDCVPSAADPTPTTRHAALCEVARRRPGPTRHPTSW